VKHCPEGDPAPARLRGLPLAVVGGRSYPLAATRRARLLGLALLDRGRAGPGLIVPRCRSVHTFGMRFALDIAFLADDGSVIAARKGVPPRRIIFEAGARAVLEKPARD
jgi:hypothetical protein